MKHTVKNKNKCIYIYIYEVKYGKHLHSKVVFNFFSRFSSCSTADARLFLLSLHSCFHGNRPLYKQLERS